MLIGLQIAFFAFMATAIPKGLKVIGYSLSVFGSAVLAGVISGIGIFVYPIGFCLSGIGSVKNFIEWRANRQKVKVISDFRTQRFTTDMVDDAENMLLLSSVTKSLETNLRAQGNNKLIHSGLLASALPWNIVCFIGSAAGITMFVTGAAAAAGIAAVTGPLGWALLGGWLLMAVSFVGYKAGRKIYMAHKKNQLKKTMQGSESHRDSYKRKNGMVFCV